MVMTSRASELLTNTTTALFNGQVSFCKIGRKSSPHSAQRRMTKAA
jgi:hypothetical protein